LRSLPFCKPHSSGLIQYDSARGKSRPQIPFVQEAEKADREFYRSLTGEQRVDILLELNRQAYGDELLNAPIERVAFMRKLGEPPRE
jgi:hypothetical protein